MFSIGKVFVNKNVVNVQKWISVLRRYLTLTEGNNKNILKSPETIFLPDLSLPEIIIPKFEAFRSYIAMECADTEKQYTYQQLNDKSNNLSKTLRKILKLQKGDIVALFSKNSPDFAVAAHGIIRSGLVVTTLNPLYTADEISKQLLDSDAKVVIAQVSLVPQVRQTFAKIKKCIPIIAIKEQQNENLPEGTINLEELINTKVDLPDAELKSNDLAVLLYSSGTTGLPKGVELTHANLVANVLQLSQPSFSFFDAPSGDYQNRVPLVIPMYHCYGFTIGLFHSLMAGSRTITIPKFSPDLFIKVLRTSNVTHIFAAPPLMLFLMNHEGVKSEYFQQVKLLVSGGAPLGYSDEMALKEKVKNSNTLIAQVYGLTETSPFFTASPRDFQSTAETGGSVGQLLPSSEAKFISVDDNSGTALDLGEKGEILAKGPQVTRGYYHRPEETNNAFLDGWLRTGDIGYCNKDGNIFITDRLKELIKVKGFQVPPAELEAVIRTHPGVEDVAVIGIPHPTHGEVPKAFIVPKNRKHFNAKDLQEYVASKVAKYKHLVGGVDVMDSIPRNPSGKILRRQLKLLQKTTA